MCTSVCLREPAQLRQARCRGLRRAKSENTSGVAQAVRLPHHDQDARNNTFRASMCSGTTLNYGPTRNGSKPGELEPYVASKEL